MEDFYSTDIRFLKGIGEKRAALYAKLGVHTFADLLGYYPRSYENWKDCAEIAQAPFNEPCCIKAAVIEEPCANYVRRGMTLYKLRVSDGKSIMKITFFNNKFVLNNLVCGKTYLFYGKVGGSLTAREMTSPQYAGENLPSLIRPVYGATQGLSSKVTEKSVAVLLKKCGDYAPSDPLTEEMLKEYGLCGLGYALKNIHFPESFAALETAKRRLVFEELLFLQLGMFKMRTHARSHTAMRMQKDYSEEFFGTLPFAPTNAQRRAVSEGTKDLFSDVPMARLVQGDVGSGKTVVAAALCCTAVKNGCQAAVMAPTEILAQQHYRFFSSVLSKSGIRCGLISGGVKAAEKKKVKQLLENGEIDVIIGTHALIQSDVSFSRLGLVVTDEQHRFGVLQRNALSKKGEFPHTLVMSATPIPRTLALMIYGDLDVSVIDELPPGRKSVETYAVNGAKRERAYGYIKKFLDSGRQAYIVCPLVEESESGLTPALQYKEKLENGAFADYKIGLLHGKMKPAEKEKVMEAFVKNEIQLLVATTVIEVGVDVPNAAVMMIENAERFGLSQLHQLRGRVGRGSDEAACILVSDAQNKQALSRLKTMTATNDGFKIAQEDLRLRGPGEFFGNRQHGLPKLKIADLSRDYQIFCRAQSAARELLEEDPELTRPCHAEIKRNVDRIIENITLS